MRTPCVVWAACAFVLPVAVLAQPQQAVNPQEGVRPSSQNPLVLEGDSHYGRREEGRVGAQANSREIMLAIAAYDEAAKAPDNAESRWKLARALYFRGSYTGLDQASRTAVFDKARRRGDEAVAIVERRARNPLPFDAKKDPDAAPSYFWAAVVWGQWALASGKLEAAKTGAADKIRDYATAVIGLDPDFEDGGGYRVLGRLHDQSPWIPFVTGWVSREEAVKNLRLAISVAPKSIINRIFMAEVLWSGSAEEKAEAIRLAESVVADAPSPNRIVEELKLQEDARTDLRKWKAAS
jgi:tetratricopeptide (TPR) repeat protein